jgi:hypothetical protein
MYSPVGFWGVDAPPEITNLHFSVGPYRQTASKQTPTKQQVLRLDVPMYDVFAVEIC